MEPLRKPTEIPTLEAREPAEPAGIFLNETYDLLDGSNAIFEAVARIQELKRTGRLVAVVAMPGIVTIRRIYDNSQELRLLEF